MSLNQHQLNNTMHHYEQPFDTDVILIAHNLKRTSRPYNHPNKIDILNYLFEVFNYKYIDYYQGRSYAKIHFSNKNDAQNAMDNLNFRSCLGLTELLRISYFTDSNVRNSGIGNVYVSRLPANTSDISLYKKFRAYGIILSSSICFDKRSGFSLGFGYVHFENKEDADKAIEDTNNTEWLDKTISVQYFKTKEMRREQNTSVYVKNLDKSLTPDELRELVTNNVEGTISQVYIHREEAKVCSSKKDQIDEKVISTLSGCIVFSDHNQAKEAAEKINGLEFKNQTLSAAMFLTKTQRKRQKQLEMRNKNLPEKFRILNLIVKNLDENISEDNLRKIFTRNDEMYPQYRFNPLSVKVCRHSITELKKAFGFVSYGTELEALLAMESLHEIALDKQVLYVGPAFSKETKKFNLPKITKIIEDALDRNTYGHQIFPRLRSMILWDKITLQLPDSYQNNYAKNNHSVEMGQSELLNESDYRRYQEVPGSDMNSLQQKSINSSSHTPTNVLKNLYKEFLFYLENEHQPLFCTNLQNNVNCLFTLFFANNPHIASQYCLFDQQQANETKQTTQQDLQSRNEALLENEAKTETETPNSLVTQLVNDSETVPGGAYLVEKNKYFVTTQLEDYTNAAEVSSNKPAEFETKIQDEANVIEQEFATLSQIDSINDTPSSNVDLSINLKQIESTLIEDFNKPFDLSANIKETSAETQTDIIEQEINTFSPQDFNMDLSISGQQIDKTEADTDAVCDKKEQTKEDKSNIIKTPPKINERRNRKVRPLHLQIEIEAMRSNQWPKTDEHRAQNNLQIKLEQLDKIIEEENIVEHNVLRINRVTKRESVSLSLSTIKEEILEEQEEIAENLNHNENENLIMTSILNDDFIETYSEEPLVSTPLGLFQKSTCSVTDSEIPSQPFVQNLSQLKDTEQNNTQGSITPESILASNLNKSEVLIEEADTKQLSEYELLEKRVKACEDSLKHLEELFEIQRNCISEIHSFYLNRAKTEQEKASELKIIEILTNYQKSTICSNDSEDMVEFERVSEADRMKAEGTEE